MNDELHSGTVCPLYHEAAELIGRRWTGAIIRAMTDGALRFGDIATAVPGISDRMLSERLKELEAGGLVQRAVFPEHRVPTDGEGSGSGCGHGRDRRLGPPLAHPGAGC